MSLPFNDAAQNDVQSAEMGALRDTFTFEANGNWSFKTTCTLDTTAPAHTAENTLGM